LGRVGISNGNSFLKINRGYKNIENFLNRYIARTLNFIYDLTIISGLVCDAKLDLGNKTSK
jgi:hypothetical protein